LGSIIIKAEAQYQIQLAGAPINVNDLGGSGYPIIEWGADGIKALNAAMVDGSITVRAVAIFQTLISMATFGCAGLEITYTDPEVQT
jgi:hypothetical protein